MFYPLNFLKETMSIYRYKTLVLILFALSSCVFAELGKEFLPAIQATRQVRNQTVQNLSNSSDFLVEGRFGLCSNSAIIKDTLVIPEKDISIDF